MLHAANIKIIISKVIDLFLQEYGWHLSI